MHGLPDALLERVAKFLSIRAHCRFACCSRATNAITERASSRSVDVDVDNHCGVTAEEVFGHGNAPRLPKALCGYPLRRLAWDAIDADRLEWLGQCTTLEALSFVADRISDVSNLAPLRRLARLEILTDRAEEVSDADALALHPNVVRTIPLLPKLTLLHCSVDVGDRDTSLDRLAAALPQLTSLTLCRLSWDGRAFPFPTLTCLDATLATAATYDRLPDAMQSLTVRAQRTGAAAPRDMLARVAAACPRLRAFRYLGSAAIDLDALVRLPHLETLEIGVASMRSHRIHARRLDFRAWLAFDTHVRDLTISSNYFDDLGTLARFTSLWRLCLYNTDLFPRDWQPIGERRQQRPRSASSRESPFARLRTLERLELRSSLNHDPQCHADAPCPLYQPHVTTLHTHHYHDCIETSFPSLLHLHIINPYRPVPRTPFLTALSTINGRPSASFAFGTASLIFPLS